MADMSLGRAGRVAAAQNDNYSMTTTSMMDNSVTELYTTEERMAITGLERLRGREVDTSMQTSDTDSAMTGELEEDDLSISQMAAKEASSSRDNPAGSDEEAFNDDSSNESLPDSKPRASSRPQKKASPTPVQSNRSNEQTSQGRPTQDSGQEASTKPPEDESNGGSGTRLAKASTTSPSHAHQASDRDNKTTPANTEAHDWSATRTQEGEPGTAAEGSEQASSEPVIIQEGETGAAEALAEHHQRLLGLWSQFNDIHQGYDGVILLLERTRNKLLLGTGGGTFLQYWHQWWETFGQSAHGNTDKLDPRNVCLQISLKFLMFLYVCERIDDLDEYWKDFWGNNDYSGILQAAEAIAENPTWMEGLQIDVITSFIPRNWVAHLSKNLAEAGFEPAIEVDPCLYISDKVIFLAYVDDCVMLATEMSDINQVMQKLKKLNMQLEEEDDIAGFLGVHIERTHDQVKLTQKGLTQQIIDALQVNDLPAVDTPADRVLGKDAEGDPPNCAFNYASVIGMLLFFDEGWLSPKAEVNE
jgi:hypothetical protein